MRFELKFNLTYEELTVISNLASYRRLDVSKSRLQLGENDKVFTSGNLPHVASLLEIEDYSFRTPVLSEVSTSDYLEIARRINEIGENISVDVWIKGPQQKQIAFDKKVTECILEIFPMTPYEAACRDVWSYITLRVLPEYAHWRFPNESNNPEWERYLGFERNTFRRLWWRAHMLGADLAVLLQEDDLVQMFERTESIGSNKLLMQSIARFALEHEAEIRSLGGKSSAIYTETAKSLRRSMVIVGYEAMNESELDSYVRKHAIDAIDRIAASKG